MRVSYEFPSLHYLSELRELRPNSRIMLRVAVDVASIFIGVVAGWTLIDGKTVAALAGPQVAWVFPFVALTAILAIVGYADAGIYSAKRRHALLSKGIHIVCINLVLMGIAGTASAFAVSHVLSTHALLMTFVTACSLQVLARVSATVLRSEEPGQGECLQQNETDPNKVLVIGGDGYIGSALVEKLLKRGMKVTVLDAMHFGEEPLARVAGHPNLTLIREDFRHIEVLTRSMSGIGSVIHLAGLVGDPACAVDPDLTVDINVTGTKLVGEIAKARGVRRFIFASSCSVYGACDEVVDEQSRFNPQSLYARTKVASEALLSELNSSEFAVTCLRFATVYGISGRTRFDLVVNLLCAKAVRDGVITVYGADQWRPFVHVDDVARAIVTTLQASLDLVAGEVFNVGSDNQNYTLGEVAELIRNQVPDSEISSDPDFVDKRNYRVSFEKIRSKLGFEPDWTLERGIAQVTALMRTNRVGHYSLPTYSNVLYLKEQGTKSFGNFRITGWENELMNGDGIAGGNAPSRPAAA
jgi:nucleoside-diphosphate-sugar epimerase